MSVGFALCGECARIVRGDFCYYCGTYVPAGAIRYRGKSGLRIAGYMGSYLMWRRIARYIVLTRDNYTCQRCGTKWKGWGKGIHAGHIVPHPWGAPTPDNLRALCSPCNGQERVEQTLLYELLECTPTWFDRLPVVGYTAEV